MNGIAFFVEVEIESDQRDAFDTLMTQHAAGTLAEESGCIQFGVYVDRTNPNLYAVYELYADQAALDIHRFSPRLAIFREATDPMITNRRIWTIGAEVDVSNFPGKED